MLEGVDPRELYGAQDVYLEQIKSLHPTLKIVARGQSLKVLGPERRTCPFPGAADRLRQRPPERKRRRKREI